MKADRDTSGKRRSTHKQAVASIETVRKTLENEIRLTISEQYEMVVFEGTLEALAAEGLLEGCIDTPTAGGPISWRKNGVVFALGPNGRSARPWRLACLPVPMVVKHRDEAKSVQAVARDASFKKFMASIVGGAA